MSGEGSEGGGTRKKLLTFLVLEIDWGHLHDEETIICREQSKL
jgi:hypothetical protein